MADAAGVGDPVRVAAYPDHAEAAVAAAVAAARRLNVPRCRVQGIGPEGEVWLMVVDTTTGTLEDLEAGGGAASAREARGPLGRLRRRVTGVPSRWWLVIGVTVVAAVAIAVVVIPRSALPVPVPGINQPAAEQVPTPPAGQLPVQAPVGWDTYASWVVDSKKPGAAAVMVGREALVVVDGGEVIGLDAKTGQERWRTGTPGNVTQLWVTQDEQTIYAARSKQGVTILDAKTGAVVANADTAAEVIGLGDVPFAQLPGQAGAVLVGKAWERRQVPATAVPIGTLGQGLVTVSTEQQQLWVTTSDSPLLPEAVPVVAPSEGLRLEGVVAFTSARLVTEWTDGRGGNTVAIDQLNAEAQLSRVGTIDAGRGGTVTVDAVSSLIGIGGQLIDLQSLETVTAPQGSIVAQAGYGWTEQTGNGRVRISEDGTILPLASGAVIPDVILPDGRAVVRAARGADGQAYYVLGVEQPKETPTPEPSPTGEEE